MASGSAPCWGELIKVEDVKKVCPHEYLALEVAIDAPDNGLSIDQLAYGIYIEDMTDIEEDSSSSHCEEIEERYKALCKAFKDRTGMGIYLTWYNTEEGECYDDLEDGANWLVIDAVSKSTVCREAESKYEINIETVGWCRYG
jgi:hypothetical protein